MFKIWQIFLTCFFLISASSEASLSEYEQTIPSETDKSELPVVLEELWDSTRYIGLEEIKPGMNAYCLTEYGTAGIEKFEMEVVDIVHDYEPGRDVILVKGIDEQFIRTGPVAGCSGSPVYIDNRLAGALALTWTYATEPLYGATPIKEILQVGMDKDSANSQTKPILNAHHYDFSGPIVLTEVHKQYTNNIQKPAQKPGSLNPLPSPLVTSGMPMDVLDGFNSTLKPYGLIAVSGGDGGQGNIDNNEKLELTPGASLVVPLVSGDIKIAAIGTVTEVIGDKVYGLGHYIFGYGAVDLPMATGKIHTVVSNTQSSFKIGSIVEVVGALESDERAGIVGTIGATSKTINLKIQVDRFNDTEKRTYNCQLVHNKLISARYLEMAVSGAVGYLGNLPPEHNIEYEVTIDVEDGQTISFENISTGSGISEVISETASIVTLLLDNPFEKIKIDAIELDIRIKPNDISSGIWSLDISDTTVKSGENIEIDVVVETVLAGKKKYEFEMNIPKNLKPDKYQMIITGVQGYEQFLTKSVPYKFMAESIPELYSAINNAVNIPREGLYCVLVLPESGVTLDKAELPDLPATKAMVLQDTKRTLRIQPYQHWIEKSIKTGTIVTGSRAIEITVED